MVCAVFGHLFAPYNPLAQQLLSTNAAPSAAHWFGTDPLGRDVLSRVIAGARDILIITPLATVLGTILGTALGLAMGYLGGAFDLVVGRIVEAFLALPFVIIAFLFVVAVGPSVAGITVIIGLVFTPLIARTVRAAVLVERQQDYVSASRLLGESPVRVMFAEILPNVMPAILVEFTVRLGYAVFAVATLSFLGFGIQPPTPDWGADISANYISLLSGYWWQTLFPALAIASLVIAVILIADSIEQVLAVMTADAGARSGRQLLRRSADPAPALSVSHLDVTYRVRGQDRLALRDVSFSIGARRVLRAGGRVRVRQVHGRARAGAVPAQQRPGERRDDQHQRAGPAVDGRGGAARPAGPHRLDGVPGAGAGAQPVDPGGAADRRGVRDRRRVLRTRRWQSAEEMLRKVQISDPGRVMRRYPHELSGGMAQRAVIAMALARSPSLLILDEPTTALDATVEAEVLDLVAALRQEFDTSVLFISHNLAVIAKMCDRVGVLYAGELVEEGPARAVFENPRHPYTVGLLRCIPRRGQRKDSDRLDTIPGFLPTPGHTMTGCIFAPRCALAQDRCRESAPAVLPGRRRPDLALLLPRAGAGPAPRHPRLGRRARGHGTTSRRPAGGRRGAVEDLRGRRPGPGRSGPVHPAGRDARAGGRVGQRQDHAGARPARAHRAGPGLGRHAARQAAQPGRAAAAAGDPARAADRVPEPGLGAQPAPHGAGPDQPPAVPAGRALRAGRCGTGWPS